MLIIAMVTRMSAGQNARFFIGAKSMLSLIHISNTSGIDVIIDGHSHELYVQTPLNKNGQPVLVTQTGTQLVGIGQVVINPATGTLSLIHI